MAKKPDYRFINKDPVIDIIRTGLQQSGRDYKEVAACAGLHPTTINNWLFKDVRRPQNITIELALTELGIERTARWIKSGEAVATAKVIPMRRKAS